MARTTVTDGAVQPAETSSHVPLKGHTPQVMSSAHQGRLPAGRLAPIAGLRVRQGVGLAKPGIRHIDMIRLNKLFLDL